MRDMASSPFRGPVLAAGPNMILSTGCEYRLYLGMNIPNSGSVYGPPKSMSTLIVAVEAGSLSAASRKLGMPLATVSRKVSELEAHLRTKLINRTSRRVILTDAGEAYVAACKKVLEEIGEAERAAMGEYSEPRGDPRCRLPSFLGGCMFCRSSSSS